VQRIMPSPFYAIIFDLDGVLADSEPWWNQIDAELLAQYGVSYRGEYHRNVLGVSYRLGGGCFKKDFFINPPGGGMVGGGGGGGGPPVKKNTQSLGRGVGGRAD